MYGGSGLQTWRLPQENVNHTIVHAPTSRVDTFETAMCNLYWVLDRTRPGGIGEEAAARCSPAIASRYVIYPMLGLVLLRLLWRGLWHLWRPVREFQEWKKHTLAMKQATEGDNERASAMKLADIERGESSGQSSEQGRGKSDPHGFAAELAGCRMSTIEMDEDAAVKELPGGQGGEEMEAGVTAVEKDAGGKT